MFFLEVVGEEGCCCCGSVTQESEGVLFLFSFALDVKTADEEALEEESGAMGEGDVE